MNERSSLLQPRAQNISLSYLVLSFESGMSSGLPQDDEESILVTGIFVELDMMIAQH